MNYWNYYKIYTRTRGIILPEFIPIRNKEIPYVPDEEQLLSIIDRCRTQKTRNALILMKETGVRIGELKQLYLDRKQNVCVVVCEKKRKIRKERRIPVHDYVSAISSLENNPRRIRRSIREIVKTMSKNTGDETYLKIHPHTFRHYFATVTYAKTRDIMLLKHLMGHESIEELNTYVHIVETMNPKKEALKLHVSEVDQAVELIRKGWKPVVLMGEYQIFEKPTFP